jgi:hypothetical protein
MFPNLEQTAKKISVTYLKYRNNFPHLAFIQTKRFDADDIASAGGFMQKRYFHLLVVLLLVTFTSIVWAQRGRGTGMPRYNPKTETTLSGTIEDLQLQTGRYRGTGTHVILKTDSGTMEVHVGPTTYIEKQQFLLAKGDHIEVLGSQVKIGGKDAFLARQITKEGKKLVLRDQNGVPLWSRRNRTN